MWPVDTAVGSTAVLVTVLLGLLSFLWWLSTRRPAGAPPGPGSAVPLLGHLPILKKDPRGQFIEWRRTYGDVLSLYMGTRFVVVLSGYNTIKEAFVKHADVFSERPHTFLTEKISKNNGIILASGEGWWEQRKTSVKILRQLGMGRNVAAVKIEEEIGFYIRSIAEHKGEAFDPKILTAMSVANNVLSIAFGQRFDYKDKDFKMHLNLLQENMDKVGGAQTFVFLPFLEHVPGDPFGVKKILNYFNSFQKIIVFPKIDMHFDHPELEDTESSDFVYAYLKELKRKKEKNIPSTLSEVQLEMVLCDLYFAGSDTTSTALLWAFLYFLHFPHEQDKLYKEIMEVVGPDRYPSIDDKGKLIYVEAFVNEVLRYQTVLPLSVYHSVSSDFTFQGHHIPKGTLVMPFLDTVHMDPDIWGDPEVFRPERFIGEDGKVTKPPELIPFSVGRRACPGEALARNELFLYLSTLIHRFRLLPEDPDKLPPFDGSLGVTWGPNRFKIRMVPRD